MELNLANHIQFGNFPAIELNLPLAANNSLGEIEEEVVVVPVLDNYMEVFPDLNNFMD